MISSGKRASTRVERKKSIGETFYVSINDMLIVMCVPTLEVNAVAATRKSE